jgi:hypothetical protein
MRSTVRRHGRKRNDLRRVNISREKGKVNLIVSNDNDINEI